MKLGGIEDFERYFGDLARGFPRAAEELDALGGDGREGVWRGGLVDDVGAPRPVREQVPVLRGLLQRQPRVGRGRGLLEVLDLCSENLVLEERTVDGEGVVLGALRGLPTRLLGGLILILKQNKGVTKLFTKVF